MNVHMHVVLCAAPCQLLVTLLAGTKIHFLLAIGTRGEREKETISAEATKARLACAVLMMHIKREKEREKGGGWERSIHPTKPR